jgi:transposase InsO family protein
MPWKETCAMDQKVQMIGDWIKAEFSITELSELYDISRPTIYKWIALYEERSADGLKELSSEPLRHPNATSLAILKKIIEMKSMHQRFGPKKIIARLQMQHPDLRWPAVSTASDILKKQGLVQLRKKKLRTPPYTEPFLGCDEPNAVWSADFKGHFHNGDGKLCHPLTISDNYSRYLLQCRGLRRPTHEQTQPWFEWTFREYGLPDAHRTDNSAPFASVSLGGLSRLSIWFIKLGIFPERIESGHPEQNPRHERMHRTLKEAVTIPPKSNIYEQQQAFEDFKYEFNYERPHESLDQKLPSSVYYSSDRPYPLRVPQVEYGGDVTVKRIKHSGEMYWKGKWIYISQALAGEPIAIKQIDDYLWEVRFSFFPLGILNDSTGKVSPLKIC